jgi:hypothetical protein
MTFACDAGGQYVIYCICFSFLSDISDCISKSVELMCGTGNYLPKGNANSNEIRPKGN